MELQRGIDLTRQGRFEEAIPLLRAAPKGYAAGFNLALCYFGIGKFKEAIGGLNALRDSGYNNAAVNNLLSQAYVGDGQPEAAFKALEAAAQQTPEDEKLYAFVADACTDHYAYSLGLRVVDLGLQHLPGSSRLHYERALFLARLDRFDEARPEFALADKLAPGSDLAYLALIQERLYEDRLPEALSIAREGIKAGHQDYRMLSLLGTVLMHAGAIPGQPQFTEARTALEASVAAQPRYSTSQIALGKLYLMEGRAKDAVVHLEIGRGLEPQNPSVYTSLARAYRQVGDRTRAEESIATLSRLLAEKASKADSP
jgi:predicted Zn-dependent protease